MMLRHLVTNWLRQVAQDKMYETVTEATRKASERPASDLASRTEGPGQSEMPAPAPALALVFGSAVEAGGSVDNLSQPQTRRSAERVEHHGYLADRRVLLVQCDMGAAAAESATRDVIATHHPSWVISTGFAASLRGEVGPGHVVMADEVVDTAGQRLPVPLPVQHQSAERSPSLHVGRLLSIDRLVRKPGERQSLADQYGALACDMETMAVGQVCQEAETRFLSIRIISEALDDQWPKEIDCLVEQKSMAAKLGVAAGAIFKRPSVVKDMWKLKEDAIKTSDRLARFLIGVASQLSNGTPKTPGPP